NIEKNGQKNENDGPVSNDSTTTALPLDQTKLNQYDSLEELEKFTPEISEDKTWKSKTKNKHEFAELDSKNEIDLLNHDNIKSCCDIPDSLCSNPNGNCNSYIECEGHTPFIKYCYSNEIFDPYTRVCIDNSKTSYVCNSYHNSPKTSSKHDQALLITKPIPIYNDHVMITPYPMMVKIPALTNPNFVENDHNNHYLPRINNNISNHMHGVLREAWFNLPNDDLTLNALIKDERYPYFPDEYLILDQFEGPPNIGDFYGQRLSTYYLAPEEGAYVFYLSCDDECELWISKNKSEILLEKVAYLTQNYSTDFREWNKYPDHQATLYIQMKKQSFYLIEAFMRETRYKDHISVGVLRPSGKLELPIRDHLYLIPIQNLRNDDSYEDYNK
ncbi:hypothetical protein MXB_4213, partial [Myxobolus squamalis]